MLDYDLTDYHCRYIAFHDILLVLVIEFVITLWHSLGLSYIFVSNFHVFSD